MSKSIDQLIDKLNSTDQVETMTFTTPLKQEQKRQLKVKLDNIFGAKLTEDEGMEYADMKYTEFKENNR